MAKFEIKSGNDGKTYFNLKAGNGEVILSSQGYASLDGAKNGVQSVKDNSGIDEQYSRETSANGKHYFNLKAGNGEVIGKSEMYESTSGMENGIASVKKNAPLAEVEVIE